MNITNNMAVDRQQLQQVSNISRQNENIEVKKDNDKISSGVEVSFGNSTIKQMDDIINENILSASSNINDISMAEDMIRAANLRILNNSSDAMMSQSKQSASVAMELLK